MPPLSDGEHEGKTVPETALFFPLCSSPRQYPASEPLDKCDEAQESLRVLFGLLQGPPVQLCLCPGESEGLAVDTRFSLRVCQDLPVPLGIGANTSSFRIEDTPCDAKGVTILFLYSLQDPPVRLQLAPALAIQCA